jgi:hypothetical protein
MSKAGSEHLEMLAAQYGLSNFGNAALLAGESVPFAPDMNIALHNISTEVELRFARALGSVISPAYSASNEVVRRQYGDNRKQDMHLHTSGVDYTTLNASKTILNTNLRPANTRTGTLSNFACELVAPDELPIKNGRLHKGDVITDTELDLIVTAEMKVGMVACAVGVDMRRMVSKTSDDQPDSVLRYRGHVSTAPLPTKMRKVSDHLSLRNQLAELRMISERSRLRSVQD